MGYLNLNKQMKSVAAVGAVATIGALAMYQSTESSQLFLSEIITADELAYMKYVTEWGKSYGTKAEFKFRLDQFKQTMAKMAEHESNSAHDLPSVSTSSLTGLTPSSRNFSVTSTSPRSQPPPSSPLRDSPPKSTGSPRVPLPQSRTKDNVDHAGLSPPLEPSRVLCKSHQELFSP